MEMFSRAEMEMLYEKAQRYFSITGGRAVPIQHIYRDKFEEYFAKIEARSHKRDARNDQQLIMKSCEKDLSGHPQCPIVVAQMEGLYFSTFVQENGIPPATSFIGESRIFVEADYFLRPDCYSLFFADFYCAPDTRNSHYIVLVLAKRGSNQERFCQANLIGLDMRGNPFLYCYENQCFVLKNGSNEIYLFHAANFNISECHVAGKCTFSRVQLLFKKTSSNKLAIDQDEICLVCGIRSGKNENNSKETALVAKMDSMSLDIGGGWRVWHFDCPDFPEYCSRCKKNILEKIERNDNNPNCKFCTLVEAVFRQMEKEKPNQQKFETPERWTDYLKLGEHLFHDHELPEQIISNWRPSMMAKQISLVKKLGIAMFRDGIVPDCDHSSCQGGGYFSMYMFTTTGDSLQLDQYDCIFDSFVSLALHDGLRLPAHLLEEVSGIFVRARTNLGHLGDNQYNNINPGDLPCKFVFELWIRDRARLKAIWPALNKWTTEQKKQHGMSQKASFKFRN